MSGIDDLISSGANHYSYYQPKEEKAQEDGDTVRGFKKAMYQIPQTAGGALALVGDAVGADGLREYGMGVYKKNEEKIQSISKESDSLTNVLEGDASAIDWLQNAAGYTGGQALTALASGGLGGLIGSQIAKRGIKEVVARGAESAMARQVAQNMAAQGAKIGAGSTLFGSNLIQEAGSIYPEAAAQAESDGRTLTGGDLARVGGAALTAAGVETAADAIMMGNVLKGGRKIVKNAAGETVSEGIGKAALREIPGAMAREAGTEGIQTGIERFGAKQDLTTADAIRDYVDSMGVGAVGGGLGGGSAILHAQKVPDAGPLSRAANAGIDQQIMRLENDPQPLISFPDGSVGHKQDLEAYLSQFTDPEERQAKQRELMGRDPSTGKKIEAEPAPDPTSADSEENSTANITAWSSQHEPVALDYAQNLISAPGAKGLDLMIAPHASGSGYTVIPSKWLSLDAQAKAMALQKGGAALLPGPDTELPDGRMIVGTDGGAATETYGDAQRAEEGRQQLAAEAVRREELGTPVPYGVVVDAKPIEDTAQVEVAPELTPLPETEQAPPSVVPTPADTGAAQENQDQPAAVTYLNPKGNPFVTEFAAKRKLRDLKLADTHEVAPVAGGFVVQPKSAADQVAGQEQQAAAVAQPAAVATATTPDGFTPSAPVQGKEVERFAGQYGKGMSGFNAKTEVNKRNRERPDLIWRAEDAEAKFGGDRYEVVGYAKPTSDKAAVTSMPAKIEPSKKVSSGAQAARDKLKSEDPFRAFLAEHGVHPEDRPDTGVDRKITAMTPGYGPVFKKSAPRLYILATKAMEAGFLTQADIDSEMDNGGTRKLVDMIGRAISNKEVIPRASADPVAGKQSIDDQLMQEAYDLGIETDGKTADQVYDEVRAKHAEQIGASPQEYDEIDQLLETVSADVLDEIDAAFDAPIAMEALSEEDINRWFGIEDEGGGFSEIDTGKSASENHQGNQAPEGGFELQGETADEIKAKQAKDEQDAADKKVADAAAAQEERASQDAKDIAARQDASAENFRLGQSAEESLSGQRDVFSQSKQDDDAKFFKVDQKLIDQAIADGIVPAGGLEQTKPFKTRTSARNIAKKTPDLAVKEVNGGFVFDPAPVPMTDADQKRAQSDVDALNKALATSGMPAVEPLFIAPSKEHALAAAVAKAFGTEVRFVSSNPEFDGVAHNGIAYLKRDMSRPELAIAGHEVFHTLEQSNPDLADKLLTHIREYLRDDAVADRKVREELLHDNQKNSATPEQRKRLEEKPITEKQVISEVLADLNGAMWLDPKFWREMAQRDQNLFRRVAYKFMEVASKAVKSLTGTRFDVKALVTDVDAVRSLIAQAWAENNQGRDGVAGGDESAISFSRTNIIGNNERTRTPEQLRAFKNVGRTIEVPTLKERMAGLWQDAGKKLAQGLADQFAPIKELSTEAYALMRLSKGAGGAFETMLRGGQLKLENGVYNFDDAKRGGVIDRLLTPLQGEMDDFLWWVSANRADKLSQEDREHLFSADDITALKSLDNGVATYDYKLQHGASAGQITRDRTMIYRDALATFNEFHKNTLDMAEQSGLIDPDARKLWESEFYVPFYRVDEESGVRGANIKSGVVRQQAFKTLKGGSGKLNSDLLDNTLQNWAHLLDSAAKNRAAKASLNAAVTMGVAVESTEEATRQMAKSIGRRNNVVWYMDSGKQRYFLVEDPYIMTALQGLEYAGMKGPLMDVLGTMKHVLTVGVTASPFFKVRNLIRDSVQAIGVSPLDYNVGSNLKQGWNLTDPKSDAYFKLLAGGGTIHFGTMLEGSESKRVRSLVESGVDASTILDNESKYKAFYKRVIEPAIDAYQELGNRGEAINRAALYDQLIKQGKSHAEASLMARDLMDFSMGGAWAGIRFLTQVVPFMNARIQGLYKLGKSAKEDPARFAVVLGAVAMSSIALMLAYSDDEDWKKREDWDRDSYWWFKIGGEAFRIPKPFEIGAIGTLAERGIEYFTSDEMTGKRFRKRLYALLSDNLAMNPTPQLVKPILDIYANKDSFSGRPIETMGMEKLKSEYRFTRNTSMAARGISTAGNAIKPEFMGEFSSPMQVDHMIKGYFGWLGALVVSTGDLIARPATGQPGGATPDYWKTATGGMISDASSPSSRYVSQMYDQAKVLEEAYGTYRMLVKQGKIEEAREFAVDNADSLRKHKSVESVKRVEARLNERMRAIERSAKSGDEKRELIQQIQTQKDRIARQIS
jgi:hypothetical protein